jgi:hypothetical protein
MTKKTKVILPEELLLNSLLLFEDDEYREEISGTQDSEESDNLLNGEETGSSTAIPKVAAEDANMDPTKTVMDLEKQNTENYCQLVKKELAYYLQERQNIVEEVRKRVLAKAKSGKQRNCFELVEFKPQTKQSFNLSEPDSGFNPGIIPKKEKGSKLNSPQESKKTTRQESSKQENLITVENKISPHSKTNKIFKKQKVKIGKPKDQLEQRTVNVYIFNPKPENPPRRAVVFNLINDSGLNNNSPEKNQTERILLKRTLAKRISSGRSKAISPKLSINNKASRNQEKQIKRTDKEKPCVLARKDLQINTIKQGSNMNSLVDQLNQVNKTKHLLINKGILNCGDRLHNGNKENKMSMKDMGKKDLGFKQLSLSEDKKSSGSIFKL